MGRSALLAGVLALGVGASPSTSLAVGVDGLRSEKGLVWVCLTRHPDTFPDCVGDRDALRRSFPATGDVTVYDGLAPGNYAIAVIHDENGNNKLDTFAGIPREGFGFSRNPAIRFGPPRFDSARFAVGTDASRQQVRMRYML